MSKIKLLLPLSGVRDDERVTKPGGGVMHTVKRKIVIYSNDLTPREIFAEEGSAFLVTERGAIHAYGGDTTVALFFDDLTAVQDYLNERLPPDGCD